MLVVVHERNVELFFEAPLDFEGFWGLDVLQVDAAKRGCNRLHRGHELVHIGGVHLNVKHIDVRKNLEENALAFHDRLARFGPNVAQTKHCRSVADHGDEVALGGVLVDVLRVFRNRDARLRHTWTVRKAQVTLRAVGFGGDDLHLATALARMVFQGFSLQVVLLHGKAKFTMKPQPKSAWRAKGCTTARAYCAEERSVHKEALGRDHVPF